LRVYSRASSARRGWIRHPLCERGEWRAPSCKESGEHPLRGGCTRSCWCIHLSLPFNRTHSPGVRCSCDVIDTLLIARPSIRYRLYGYRYDTILIVLSSQADAAVAVAALKGTALGGKGGTVCNVEKERFSLVFYWHVRAVTSGRAWYPPWRPPPSPRPPRAPLPSCFLSDVPCSSSWSGAVSVFNSFFSGFAS